MGRIVATPGALNALQAACMDAGQLLAKHQRGEWGQIDSGDVGLNEESLRTGGRLLSVYPLPTGSTLWVITEADRSATTLLLPEDY